MGCERLSIGGGLTRESPPSFRDEARRQDKTLYPPRTLVMLVAGIKCHLREMECLASLSWGIKTQDARFVRTRGALDARMK